MKTVISIAVLLVSLTVLAELGLSGQLLGWSFLIMACALGAWCEG